MRNLKVAAVQMRCESLHTMENLTHADAFIEKAASEGAKLILLPELMPGGYLLTEEIWTPPKPMVTRALSGA
jgi:N-carbamoylputrescine amidase